MNKEEIKRPPMGLIPRKLHEEQRIEEISKAILRYAKVEKPIPEEWIKELFDLDTLPQHKDTR